mmetsp:Transcript_3152/g.9832  ORF Transcript_3152/g.9832 Transcript_3152/m.9832 type:complete len:203 (-) Transcript_3152:988-1596(-)
MPGESMPAAWIRSGSVAHRSMIQSPRLDFARAPEKEWKASSVSKSGTRLRQAERMEERTCCFESGSTPGVGHLSTSRAVGPRMRLPQSVFWTRMPLPSGPGQGKRMWLQASPCDFLSKTYSPNRGLIWNDSSPTSRATLSDAPPAQLTTYLARTVSLATVTPPIARREPEPPTFIASTSTACSPLTSCGYSFHGPASSSPPK